MTRVSRTLSIIVPLLNEQQNLPALVRHLSTLGAEQLILVDGGSTDGSADWLKERWQDHQAQRWLVECQPGRAEQMNAGARIAQTDMLLFLHADTRLPAQAKQEIALARDHNYFWGRFDVQFDPASRINRAMKVIALAMNIRSRLSSIATGDQAIFVDRALFIELRGFPLLPIMEDIAMSKILKQHGVPYCSQFRVRTSARRWQQRGVVRTVGLMWLMRLAFFVGVSPTRLHRWYRNIR